MRYRINLIITALTYLLLSIPCLATPAPLPKVNKNEQRIRRELSGVWILHWYGATGTVTLFADGRYHCLWCGLTFIGTWHLEDRIVVVVESHNQKSWINYKARINVTDPPISSIWLERPR